MNRTYPYGEGGAELLGPTLTVPDESRTMIELSGKKIYAIPYTRRRPLKPIRLPDGSIVEIPTPEQRCHAPEWLTANFERPDGYFVGLLGVFLLSTGKVAAVYGATQEAIG
jgi:hypothetical protein